MIGIRRRRLPEELVAPRRAFAEVLAAVEAAKEELARVVPTTRLPGRPVPDALIAFEQDLRRARTLMPAWRRVETEDVWTGCEEALDRSLGGGRRLREDAPDLGGFEGLLAAVQDLMDPLAVFEDAAARFDQLRA